MWYYVVYYSKKRIKKIENFFISERVIKIIGIIVFIQYKQRCGSYKKMMDNINHKYNLSNKSLMNVESYVFFRIHLTSDTIIKVV